MEKSHFRWISFWGAGHWVRVLLLARALWHHRTSEPRRAYIELTTGACNEYALLLLISLGLLSKTAQLPAGSLLFATEAAPERTFVSSDKLSYCSI